MSAFWISVLVVVGLCATLAALLVWDGVRLARGGSWAQRRGRGFPVSQREYRGAEKSFASALAHAALASAPQAYRRVHHGQDRWMRELAQLHTQCAERCVQQVVSYCRKHPDTAKVRVRFRLLDPPELQTDHLSGPMVFRCASGRHQPLCHSVCQCDTTDEICPTGDHLQIGAAPPDAPVDSPPQMVRGALHLQVGLMEFDPWHPGWARIDQGRIPGRGTPEVTYLAPTGSAKTRYSYNWSRR